MRVFVLPAVCLLVSAAALAARPTPVTVPAPMREFRAAWVATVDNIDWPSRPGLPVEQQKAELLAILDRARELRLNAIVLQVRPACDALYPSRLEPWSEYLTGTMGQAPEPPWDPLATAVAEAHARGLELHAWFNPYRAHHPSGKSPISETHLSRSRPELVRTYGKQMWLDPGLPEVQAHSLAVMRDVVRRYDLDGVHIDDYFYPYKEKDPSGKDLPFPDDPSWQRYVAAGGKLARDDWRRDNVNQFVRRLYKMIKSEKRWVRFGISPFGIWRPGYPAQIKGFDQYAELYADARKWLVEGSVDYFTPQLYWPIAQEAQSYPVLLKWWTEQNPKGRHLWPGNYTSRVGDGSRTGWKAQEVVDQVLATRAEEGARGNVHFSMKALMANRGGVAELLKEGPYAAPALPPKSPWLDSHAPPQPRLTLAGGSLSWKPGGREPVWLWVLQRKAGERWMTEVLPGITPGTALAIGTQKPVVAALSAVDRCGNQSTPAVLRIP